MAQEIRGIFPILATPYSEDMEVDEEELRQLVNYLIDQGAHGLAPNGGSSECHRLTVAERLRMTDWVLEENGGRLPVIVGVSAAGTAEAVHLARYASERGADGVFGTPPIDGMASPQAIYAHYQALNQAVEIPIVVQEETIPVPTPLIVRMVEELEHVNYVKEERPALAGLKIGEILAASDRVRVLSGGGNFMEELAQGAVGAIPGSVAVAGYARVFDAYTSGDLGAAWAEYERILPLVSFRQRVNVLALTKEVLRRQGVFTRTRLREPAGPPLDAVQLRVLDTIMERMGPPY
jgi:4-hydroxy-tetrahydrodipicolinate synthase